MLLLGAELSGLKLRRAELGSAWPKLSVTAEPTAREKGRGLLPGEDQAGVVAGSLGDVGDVVSVGCVVGVRRRRRRLRCGVDAHRRGVAYGGDARGDRLQCARSPIAHGHIVAEHGTQRARVHRDRVHPFFDSLKWRPAFPRCGRPGRASPRSRFGDRGGDVCGRSGARLEVRARSLTI